MIYFKRPEWTVSFLCSCAVQIGEHNLTKRKKGVKDKMRRSTVACIVTEHEQGVIKALAFLRKTSMSEVLYAWIKPFVDEAAESPEVKKLIAIQEQEEITS